MQINEQVLARTIERFRERKVLLPTFAQMRNPESIPDKIKNRLRQVGLWDIDPVNLFRITWKNEPVEKGGLFNDGNWIEFPSELTGVDTRIIGIMGKYFPTGAHKVGAAYGCLIPKLVSGQFDPTSQKAVWPSTGNYCRGGAFDSALLGCTAVAILPEEMSRERFEWLKEIGAEVIATPGCESNVKEIYDKCWEIRKTRPECVIFNQFEEFGNPCWHYHVTAAAIQDIFEQVAPGHRLAGYVSATGSAGTIAAGDRLRKSHPDIRVIATEAQQCPTLYQFGFGGHRIEGIGDKHVPWIHNVRNTDMIAAIDDEQCMSLFRLFNEREGQASFRDDLPPELIEQLPNVGISGICNLVAAIKAAKYYDMTGRDVIFLCLTDGADLYSSRLEELTAERGAYSAELASNDRARYLDGITLDYLRELTYADRKALHNFKYFTWVEQQGRSADELRELWNPDFWDQTFAQAGEWDRQIEAFNKQTGVLELLQSGGSVMPTLFRDCLLVQLDPPTVTRGDLRQANGRIVSVGSNLTLQPGDEIIDGNGAVLMPGLVCGHTHLYSALAAGMPAPPRQPRNFHEILELIWWRLDRAHNLESVTASGQVGALSALRCGTTTLVDHHASPNCIEGSLAALEQGIADVGCRGVLCYEVTDRNRATEGAEGLVESERYIRACQAAKNGRFAALVGAHASFTLSEKSLADCVELASELGVGIHIHVAEDPVDEKITSEKFGCGLIDRFERVGLLEVPGTILGHGTHLSELDFARLTEYKNTLHLAHNPSSNMNNGVGYTKVANATLPVVLGTDGIGADMWREARIAEFKSHDAHAPLPFGGSLALLAESARLASRALGVKLGSLEMGAAADLVLTNYRPSTPLTSENLAGHFLFALGPEFVQSVMIDGHWCLRDGQVVSCDEPTLRAEAVRTTRELWARM